MIINTKGRIILASALSIVLALLVFRLGEYVGFSKARYSFASSEAYERLIDGGSVGMMGRFAPRFDRDMMPGGHGAVGQVVSIAWPNLVVSSPDNVEKTVVIGSSTIVRKFRDAIGGEAIQVGDVIVALGNPDASGAIDAKLIRILPPPATSSSPFIRY